MSFFKKEESAVCSEFYSMEQKCLGGGRVGKCAQAVSSPGSPYSSMEIPSQQETSWTYPSNTLGVIKYAQ